MPEEYVKCVESYVNKGISEKTAKARCAAAYFKRHGITVKEAHEKGYATIPELSGEEVDLDLIELIMDDLANIENMANTKATATVKKNTTDAFINKETTVIATNFDMLEEFNIVEITATMVGAHAYTSDGIAVEWTERALKNAEKSWELTRVSAGHKKTSNYGRVLASFLDGKLLKMILKVTDEMKGWIRDAKDKIGVSIEAINTRINKNFEITSAQGSGVTFVFPPDTPACKIKEGCGINGTEVKHEDTSKEEITEHDVVDSKVVLSNYIDYATDDNTTGNNVGVIFKYEPDITTGTEIKLTPPHNINEDKPSDNKEVSGGKMSEEEKPKTICAKEHEKVVATKDAQIETLGKEIETLKATVAKFESEKKELLLKELAGEGIDATVHKDKPNEIIATMIETIRSYKKKLEDEPVVDSGAVIKATETQTNVSGTAFTDAADAAKKAAEDAAKLEQETVKLLMDEKKKRGY